MAIAGPVGLPTTKKPPSNYPTPRKVTRRSIPQKGSRRNQTWSPGSDYANAAAMLAAKRGGHPGGQTPAPEAQPGPAGGPGNLYGQVRQQTGEPGPSQQFPMPNDDDTPHRRAAKQEVMLSMLKMRTPNTQAGPGDMRQPQGGVPEPQSGLPGLPQQQDLLSLPDWVDQQPWGAKMRAQRQVPKGTMDRVMKMYAQYQGNSKTRAGAGQQRFDNQMALNKASGATSGASGLKDQAADQLATRHGDDSLKAYGELAAAGRKPDQGGGLLTARGVQELLTGNPLINAAMPEGQGTGWMEEFKRDPIGTFVSMNAFMEQQGEAMLSPEAYQKMQLFIQKMTPPLISRKAWFAKTHGAKMPEDPVEAEQWTKVFGATFPDVVGAQQAGSPAGAPAGGAPPQPQPPAAPAIPAQATPVGR